jgi:hypothetical protein
MAALTPTEIDAVVAAVGVPLPNLYRQLLAEIGPGRFGDRELYHPAAVRDLYEPYFDDPAQLFAPYFPFGCDNRLQEIWVIDAARGMVASIWHETLPDDWPDEPWLPCDEWRRQYLPTPEA